MGEELSLAGVRVNEIKPRIPAPSKPTVSEPVLLAQKRNCPSVKILMSKASKCSSSDETGGTTSSVTDEIVQYKSAGRNHLPLASDANTRLLRRSKSSGVKMRKKSNGNPDKISLISRDHRSLSNQSLPRSNKESSWKKENKQKTELPFLSLEKCKKLSKEEARELEIEKTALKNQQRREIYALNREMRKIENDAFQAFMNRCGNDLRAQIATAGCKPVDNELLAGGRV